MLNEVVFLKHETIKNYVLGGVARLVLHHDDHSDSHYVSVFNTLNFTRIMVSLLFYHGTHLGKMHFVWQWILLYHSARTGNGTQ